MTQRQRDVAARAFKHGIEAMEFTGGLERAGPLRVIGVALYGAFPRRAMHRALHLCSVRSRGE
jgi:hypothetical protein